MGVSLDYLSNLETGKTQKVEIPFLDKIQKELIIFSMVPPDQQEDELSFRFQRIHQQFRELSKTNPKAAEYLLSSFENGLEHFMK